MWVSKVGENIIGAPKMLMIFLVPYQNIIFCHLTIEILSISPLLPIYVVIAFQTLRCRSLGFFSVLLLIYLSQQQSLFYALQGDTAKRATTTAIVESAITIIIYNAILEK